MFGYAEFITRLLNIFRIVRNGEKRLTILSKNKTIEIPESAQINGADQNGTVK
jgi:hypothetical protein